MTNRRTLRALSAGALALSLTLAGCGGGSSGSAQAPGDTPTVTPDSEPPAPQMPKTFTGKLALTADETTDLLSLLDEPDDSDIIPLDAGESKTRGGVVCTCNSKHACTVTLTNNLGVIEAMYKTKGLDSNTQSVRAVAVVVPPEPEPVFGSVEGVNPANSAAIAAIMMTVGADTGTETSLMDGNMSDVMVAGIGAADDSVLVLTGPFNPVFSGTNDFMIGGLGNDAG